MVVKKVWLIPVGAVATGLGAMIVGYVIGVAKHHIPAVLPFVSDGGALAPENCIFSQLLNMSSFFLVLTFYMRHRQAVEYYGHRLRWDGSKWRKASLYSMWIGVASAIGVTMIANFPESEMPVTHIASVAITLLLTNIYLWGQVFMGYMMVPRMASMPTNHLRCFLAILATAAMIMYQISLSLHPFAPAGDGPPGGWYGIHWWKPGDPFFLNHVVSTGCQWLTVVCQQLFILSFVSELRFAYAHAPRVVFRRTASELGLESEPHRVKIVHVPTVPEQSTSSQEW